jgi:signal transduction histidine kinase
MAHTSETFSEEDQLATLFEIGEAIASQIDQGTMLTKCLSSLVVRHPAVDAGFFLICDSESMTLRVAATHGYDLSAFEGIVISPGEAISGHTFHAGRTILYPSPEDITVQRNTMKPANRRIFDAAIFGSRSPQSAISLVLGSNHQRIGVLLLENQSRPAAFSPRDIPFLERLSELVGLAIQRGLDRHARLAEAEAVDEDSMRAELISTLAHQMRTPLTSIRGYATALLMEDANFPLETQRQFLEFIDEECETLEVLIHDFLESSRIDAGLLHLQLQPVLLPRLAGDVVNEIAHKCRKHRFLVDFPEAMPIVEADPERLAEVLRNLLDNAVKYSPTGGLVVIRGESVPGEVIISIADQGIGIAPEDLNRLFEKYFRAKTSVGHHVIGSGLGLPIARTIVESHGGRIWAESQVDRGTTMYFTIPLKDIDWSEEE